MKIGFISTRLAGTDGVSLETVKRVRIIIGDPKFRQKIVNKNFEIAKKYFSYELLKKLTNIINNFKL